MTTKNPTARRHVSTATLAVLAAGAALSAALVVGGSFAETFDDNLLPATLETTGASPSLTGGAVVFTDNGGGDWDRGYARTVDNYDATGFVAEVTVTVAAGAGGAGMGFFGFGAGEPNYWFFGEPMTPPSIYARISPNDFGHAISVTNGPTEHIGLTFGEAGDGTHRVRTTWNPATQGFTVAIQSNYPGGPFVPTTTIGPVTVTDTFSSTDSRIFFGGAGNATFDDFVVLAPAGTPGQLNCLGVSRNALAREFGGLAHAAAALGFENTAALQAALNAYCGS